ncbi:MULTISPECIES: hypothetical protein [unclassified Neptuniibacter]|uniref:hypothetical protein n=1 Tax=unclassified Neptuniibacter TaxID=2630693 RepID=UPI000C4785AF|nr:MULTISPECIES: hypothetical protein [unclassified Neptuniibacter]MAY42415.1 hypothetical protein [Oceanospirillaceae bacterium]|tara:strand:+ start:32583 stop:32987 length:405 start_codon:yes stop_codon:yes gene_type:complete
MTTPTTHPATHTLNQQPYRQTQRAIFRLSACNEWVRSNVSPNEFRRQAKANGEAEQNKSNLTREERYLKQIEETAAELREYYTVDTLPSPNTIRLKHGISEISARRACLMFTKGVTAKQARDTYKTSRKSKTRH